MSGPTYLVYKKQRVDIGVRVVSYLEADQGAPSFYHVTDKRRRFSRITFENIQGARKDAVDKVIIHHDGMRDSRGCFQVLVQRNLSTHLMVDTDGTVYQPLDLSDEAWHAAPFNKQSVGVDLNNPIHPDRVRDPIERKQRGVYSGRINGGLMHSLGYTDAQYASLTAVVRGLMKIFPRLKPMAPIGLDNRVLRTKLEDLAFVGVVGHLHVSANKWDPGPGFDWERFLIGVRGNDFHFPLTLKGTRNLAQVPKERALREARPYFDNTERGPGGYFPVGVNQAWHTGIHLNVDEGTPVHAPADGLIVVARNTRLGKMGSPNMVLIRHDLSIDNQQRTFFSLLMHLQEETLDAQKSRLPWIRRLAQMDGPLGLPSDEDSDHPLSAPGFIALINHRAALIEVPVKAGELVGYSSTFSPAVDGSEMSPLLDFSIFADLPLFPRSDTTFERVDDDIDPDILCNARAVWKRYTQDPEALRGLVEGGYPLAPAEIRAFFGGVTGAENTDGRRPHEELRWLCCKHVVEWSDRTDFSGLFGGGVDFEWSTRKEAKRYVDRIRKLLWWDKRVTQHIKFNTERVVWAYHPIALLAVLALGEARRALNPGKSGFMKGLDGEALRRARKEDAILEREEGMEHRHVEVHIEGISGGQDIYEDEQKDPESEAWMRWEQGEWPQE
ncbi:N-acetylmuramoyl-L-alanine amidase [Myxococcota bacterium]|nr:N-acetylmuramoyl-L-alanine amidase [Myxococcota bacterium]MBU1433040.1 N-acetylmuramoyl-L-alanine amidase [Myxococcota bacterium]MBU1899925.1 N-acetylmuramoyl-L-alanine amidase [Myxococcota bacterium]